MKKYLSRMFLMFACVLMLTAVTSLTANAKVKLNKSKASIYVGSSTTLKVKGTKKKAKWSTSNKKIAKVTQKGKVTGIKKGNAKIAAKVGKKKYICKVTVKEKSTTNTNTTITTETPTNNNNQTTETPTNNNSNQEPAKPQTDSKNEESKQNQNDDNSGNQSAENNNDNKVVLQSLTSDYTEALVKKDGWADATEMARQLHVKRVFSDGTSEPIDAFANPGVYKTDLDTSTVGTYEVTLSCTGEKNSKVPLTIQVSVCDVQENDDFTYISNGNIAEILSYKGESENIVIPEEINGATVVGGSILDGDDYKTYKTISIPKGWRYFYSVPLFQAWEKLEEIVVDPDNEYYSSKDGVLFDKNQETLWRFPINKQSDEYSIPDTVTSLVQGSFFNCVGVKKVIIPKSVIEINKSLRWAIMPFENSEEPGSLEEIEVEEGNPIFKSMDGVLFMDYQVWDEDIGQNGDYRRIYNMICYPTAKKDQSYRIPDGVTNAIDMNCNPNLKELVVPRSMTHWGYYPVKHMDGLSVYFDFDDFYYERDNNYGWRVAADIIEDSIEGTIYVRNSVMREKIIELLKDEYGSGYNDYWTVSDNYEW